MSDDLLIKSLMVGPTQAGKSATLIRFSDDTFQDKFITTIGVDFKIRTIKRGKYNVKCQIWDTAGQERFRTITRSYYRGASLVYLCFDCSGQAQIDAAKKERNKDLDGPSATIESLEQFRADVENYCEKNVVVVVCGLKNDLQDEEVVGAAAEFADKHDYRFCTCSAKTNQGIEEMFIDEGVDGYLEAHVKGGGEEVIKKIKKNLDDDDDDIPFGDDEIRIVDKKKKKNKKAKGSFFPSAAQIFGLKK